MTTPVRIQLKRTKGWRMPMNTVKVGRPGKWGNQFVIGDHVMHYTKTGVVPLLVKDTATAVDLYRKWLEIQIEQHRHLMLPALNTLRGKNLACWCKPGEPCHADVLLEFANRPVKS